MYGDKKFINNLNELNYYLKNMDNGGIDNDLSFNGDNDESITLAFDSNGGWSEDLSLFIHFKFVQTFHLGISMNLSCIGIQIDEIKKVNISHIKDIMPYKITTNIDTCCFRFFSQGKPTNYYVICDGFLCWIEGYDKLNPHYKFEKQI